MKSGDLVHVPSNVLLLSDTEGSFKFTTEPTLGIVTRESLSDGKYYKIYCLGREWTIRQECAYPFSKKETRDVN